MISVTSGGSFNKTKAFLRHAKQQNIMSILHSQAAAGVAALSSATPQESGLASDSWGYEVVASGGGYSIYWTNNDIENGFPVAIMLQYGYGTGTGGYVQGRDYINPAMRPVFDKIAETVWKAVISG